MDTHAIPFHIIFFDDGKIVSCLLTNLKSETCWYFDWMLQLSSGNIYSHTLPPHHLDSATRDPQSFTLSEALLQVCHLDVQPPSPAPPGRAEPLSPAAPVCGTGNQVQLVTWCVWVALTTLGNWKSDLGAQSCSFSGFSVGCCVNREKVICYQLEFGK